MKLKPEQLARTLKSESFPLYWLAGDESLLLQEAADSVRLHFRNSGVGERELFNIDKGFKWESFSHATSNLSLFAKQKLFELRLSSSKLDETGKSAIKEFLDEENPDHTLLISSPKLEAGLMNTKWFKGIEPKSIIVQIWPINKDGLSNWLSKRLIQEGINADAEALQLLSDKIEGNLLAAMQEIEKLKLLTHKGADETINLDANTVMQVIADSSRYSVYNLIDSALLGDGVRCQKILQNLRDEGLFPLIIVGALSRELRLLLPMIEKHEDGQGINAILQANRVWFNRKQAVSSALQRLHSEDIWRLLDKVRRIDQTIKGMSLANPWDELSLLVLEVSGQQTASMQKIG